MTKADLIREVSQALKLLLKDADYIIEVAFASMVRSIRDGDKVLAAAGE
jgi:nucleoid DNA-binding protein